MEATGRTRSEDAELNGLDRAAQVSGRTARPAHRAIGIREKRMGPSRHEPSWELEALAEKGRSR